MAPERSGIPSRPKASSLRRGAPKTCLFCDQTFSKRSNLLRHLKREHNEILEGHQDSLHRCHNCNRTYKKASYLKKHVCRTRVVCPFCCRTYSKQSNLDKHLDKAHKGTSEDKDGLHRCHQCGETFKRASHLQRHLQASCCLDTTSKQPSDTQPTNRIPSSPTKYVPFEPGKDSRKEERVHDVTCTTNGLRAFAKRSIVPFTTDDTTLEECSAAANQKDGSIHLIPSGIKKGTSLDVYDANISSTGTPSSSQPVPLSMFTTKPNQSLRSLNTMTTFATQPQTFTPTYLSMEPAPEGFNPTPVANVFKQSVPPIDELNARFSSSYIAQLGTQLATSIDEDESQFPAQWEPSIDEDESQFSAQWVASISKDESRFLAQQETPIDEDESHFLAELTAPGFDRMPFSQSNLITDSTVHAGFMANWTGLMTLCGG